MRAPPATPHLRARIGGCTRARCRQPHARGSAWRTGQGGQSYASRGVVLPGALHGCHSVHGRPPTLRSFDCAFIVVSSGSMIVGFLFLVWSFGQPSP
eukprot:COSAG02_NODE_6697_length_3415_cov_2.543727_3_plen_97_part_00